MKATVVSIAGALLVLATAGCSSSGAGSGSGKMEMHCSKCSMDMKADMTLKCPCGNDVKVGDLIMRCTKCNAEVKCADCTGACPKCKMEMSQGNAMCKCPKCGGTAEAKGMCCPKCMPAKK